MWIRIDLKIRIHHFSLLRIRTRIQFRIQNFDKQYCKKFTAVKLFLFFGSKIEIIYH